MIFWGATKEAQLWTIVFLLGALAVCGLVSLYQHRKNKKDTMKTKHSDRR